MSIVDLWSIPLGYLEPRENTCRQRTQMHPDKTGPMKQSMYTRSDTLLHITLGEGYVDHTERSTGAMACTISRPHGRIRNSSPSEEPESGERRSGNSRLRGPTCESNFAADSPICNRLCHFIIFALTVALHYFWHFGASLTVTHNLDLVSGQFFFESPLSWTVSLAVSYQGQYCH